MRIRTGVVLGLLLALSAAGCGKGAGGDEVATAGGKTPEATSSAKPAGDDKDAILAYSKCMRENGLPDFPDPEVGENGEFRMRMPAGYDKEKVDKAQEACKRHLPNGGEPQKANPEDLEKMRKYAQCMRANGVPKFPDPKEGGFQIDGNTVGDPESPAFKAAEEKCRSLMPGPPGGGKGSLERNEG